MRIVTLGAPGSGKRTQTGLLANKYGLEIITSAELVKNAMAEESERGAQLRLLHQSGQGVTEDIVLGLLQERLVQSEMSAGFILDGFPRNLLQALTLDEILAEIGQTLDFVLLFHIENDTLMERLVGRRTCRSCGAVYNIYTRPSVVEDVCDDCGGRLYQRSDDTEATVSNRLHVFDHLTSPLLSHYGKQSRLLRIDADGEVEAVFSRTCEAIGSFLSRPSPVVSREKAFSEAISQESGQKSGSAPAEEVSTAAEHVPQAPESAGPAILERRKPAVGNGGRKAHATGVEKPPSPKRSSVTKSLTKKGSDKITPTKKAGKSVGKAQTKKPGTGEVGTVASKGKAPAPRKPMKTPDAKTTDPRSAAKRSVSKKAPATTKSPTPKGAKKKVATGRSAAGKKIAKQSATKKAAKKNAAIQKRKPAGPGRDRAPKVKQDGRGIGKKKTGKSGGKGKSSKPR